MTKTTYVIRKGTEEEGHMMEEKPIESPRKENIEEENKLDEADIEQNEVVTT